MAKNKIHWLPTGTTAVCGVFAGFEGVLTTDHWSQATCLKCTRPTPHAMAQLHRDALILNEHRSLPRECPDGSGRVAEPGQHWVRNARFGGWQLEADGTPWSCSVGSETYWQS